MKQEGVKHICVYIDHEHIMHKYQISTSSKPGVNESIYIYIYICIYIQTYIHTYIHTRRHTHTHIEVKEEKRWVEEEAVEEDSTHRLLGSVSVCAAGGGAAQHVEAAQRAWAGSWQHRQASLHSHPPLSTTAVTLTPRSPRASSNKRRVRRWSMLRRKVWLARWAGRLMSSSAILQPSPPAHHTTHST